MHGAPEIDGIATRAEREMSILVWNYHDDDVPAPASPVRLTVAGVPAAARALVEHYRIDETHSNAYTVWKQMGSPQQPYAGTIHGVGSGGPIATADFARMAGGGERAA